MNVTENTKALILQGLRKKSQTKLWLAEQMGLHKSWATRLLNGQIKTLDDAQVERLMQILDIKFFTLKRVDESQISAKAMGHTAGSSTLFRHYRRAVTHQDGRAFFR